MAYRQPRIYEYALSVIVLWKVLITAWWRHFVLDVVNHSSADGTAGSTSYAESRFDG